MASPRLKSEISSEKLSNDFLTCPLCFELYTTPKVLFCQHTFCLACLRQYVRTRGFASTIPCPLCKDLTRIPDNDVSHLKNNYTIVNLLQCVEESMKTAAKEKPVTPSTSGSSSTSASDFNSVSSCGACSESKALIQYCDNCCFWLCGTCTTSHRRVPATSHHTLQTSEEINIICKNIAVQGEAVIHEIKQSNDDKTEIILGQIEELPTLMGATRLKIETAGDSACQIIREKEKNLLHQLGSFQRNQQETFSRKLQILECQNSELSRISRVLDNIKISSDGYQNHTTATAVERDIKSISPLRDFPSNVSDLFSMSFTPSRIGQCDLEHMNLGKLRVVKGFPDQRLFLQDHSLKMHKVEMLGERGYITGLAINRFAEKYVVANNESVYVFKPQCRQPTYFMSPDSRYCLKKPWGIAFCESDNKVYITVAGDEEGKGAVYIYRTDGTKHSVLASGLTLPRGIALHKGLVYVCDQIDRCVYILDLSGRIVKVLKKLPDGTFLFDEPMFVSVGADCRIAVSDAYQSIKIFSNEYTLLFTYSPEFMNMELWDVLILHDGTIIVCDWKQGLHKISRDFHNIGLISIEGNMLQEPSALSSLDNSNVIYVGNGMGEICSAI